MLLTIELVPNTCWFSNIRDHVTPSQWQIIKEYTSKLAGSRCEICNGQGTKWPVECHEVWNYDDKNKIQKLERTIALCPMCHKVKHIGYAKVTNTFEPALNHFMRINGLSKKQSLQYINQSFKIYHHRSTYNWKLDLTWMNLTFGFNITPKR